MVALKLLAALLALALIVELGGIFYCYFLAPASFDNSRARHHVLIIGDCNTTNIVPYIRANLGDDYVVSRSDRWFSSRSVCFPATLDWIAYKSPEYIYFDIGMLDIEWKGDKLVTSKDEFRKNLENFIEKALEAGKATLIGGTMNPVNAEAQRKHFGPNVKPRQEEDVTEYNKILTGVMRANRIPAVDIHARVVATGTDKYVADDGFHLSPKGHEFVASLVCDKIRELRNERPRGLSAAGRVQGYVVPDKCAPAEDQPLSVPDRGK